MKTFFYTIFICSLFSITFAQPYYVSTTGSDIIGTGTSINPWATIEYAITTVPDPTIATIINVVDGTYNLSNNQIDINRGFTNLTILGGSTGGTVVQAANDLASSSSRVFYINAANKVTIKNMSIRYGQLTVSTLNNNGCGVYNEGTLTLDYCEIYENRFVQVTLGGYGIGVGNVDGKLTITNSTIRNNSVTLTNLGTTYGGGVGSLNGEVNISNSTISNNISNGGGGISFFSRSSTQGVLNITNTTIYGNSATATDNINGANGDFGGIRISVFSNGSSIITDINSCTIFKNYANRSFGGIGLATEKSPSSIVFTIENSIVDGNTFGNNSPSDINGLPAQLITINSEDYNLIYSSSGVTIGGQVGNNIYGIASQCSDLAPNTSSNGTQTCLLPSTSPAKDKIPSSSPNGAPLLDQRGAGRLGNYDIGAYEWWGDDGAMPVELTSFTSRLKNNKVFLKWETATELNNYGFNVERNTPLNPLSRGEAEGRGVWEKIGFVNGSGTSNSPKEYSYVDENLFGGSNFQYRLKQIDFDGQFEYSNVVEVKMIPSDYSLSQNYPNPFNPSTKIEYSVPEKSNVSIKIYGLLGNEILELFAGEREPGIYEVEFNAQGLSNGVYFYRMQAGKFVQTRKMILMK